MSSSRRVHAPRSSAGGHVRGDEAGPNDIMPSVAETNKKIRRHASSGKENEEAQDGTVGVSEYATAGYPITKTSVPSSSSSSMRSRDDTRINETDDQKKVGSARTQRQAPSTPIAEEWFDDLHRMRLEHYSRQEKDEEDDDDVDASSQSEDSSEDDGMDRCDSKEQSHSMDEEKVNGLPPYQSLGGESHPQDDNEQLDLGFWGFRPRTLVKSLKSWEGTVRLIWLDEALSGFAKERNEKTQRAFLSKALDMAFLHQVYLLHLINCLTPPVSDPASLANTWTLKDDPAGENPTYRGKFWIKKLIDEYVTYLRSIVQPRFHEPLEPLLNLVRERLGRRGMSLRKIIPQFEVEHGVSISCELLTSSVELPFYPARKTDKKNILFALSRSPWLQKNPDSTSVIGRDPSILFWGSVTEVDVARLRLLTPEAPGRESTMWGLRNAQNLVEWHSLFFYQVMSTIAGRGELFHYELSGIRARCCDALDKLRSIKGMRLREILDEVFLGEIGPEVMALVTRIEAMYASGKKRYMVHLTSTVSVINHVFHCVQFNRTQYVQGNPKLLDEVLSVYEMLTPEIRSVDITSRHELERTLKWRLDNFQMLSSSSDEEENGNDEEESTA